MRRKYEGNMLFVSAYRLSGASEHSAAREVLKKAYDTREVSLEELAVLLNNLGASDMQRENFAGAISFLEQAIEIKRKIGDRASLGLTCANLGFTRMKIGDYLKGTESVIEGAQLIAKSSRPEYNAQIVANFVAVAYTQAPPDQGAEMRKMWSKAGCDKLSWPSTSIVMRHRGR
jgi:tetratricopeptide (TPR) repeat protein